MELIGKKVMVIGLARTGCATARFLARHKADVWVTDIRPEAELAEARRALAGLPIRYLCGGQDPAWAAGFDVVVPSPGVPKDNPLIAAAREAGATVISEIELAYRFLKVPLIAITGTNGKSTTTTLVGEMLKADGQTFFAGGNLGSPLIGFAEEKCAWGVVEISSFQLEWVESFRPTIAVLLNVSEDHLDRYPDVTAYCRIKERIFAAQTGADIAVLNRDDPLVWEMRSRMHARVVSFGSGETGRGLFPRGAELVWREGSDEETFPLARVRIQGRHNVENMMAAIAAAKSAGVGHASIQAALESFPGLEHRLEFVRDRGGVRYYNDSKGTNVGAVVKSLASFSGNVILIAGGVDKGGDYGPLAPEIRNKVKRLILFGAAKGLMAEALGRFAETVIVDNLETAVHDAAAHARPGDVVLLSPACSSFDMFQNYAERGKAFKALVHGL